MAARSGPGAPAGRRLSFVTGESIAYRPDRNPEMVDSAAPLTEGTLETLTAAGAVLADLFAHPDQQGVVTEGLTLPGWAGPAELADHDLHTGAWMAQQDGRDRVAIAPILTRPEQAGHPDETAA